MRGSLCIALVLAGVTVARADVASAQQPKVVVLDFAGRGGDKARIQVIRALKGRASFAPKAEAEKVLAKEGLSGTKVSGRAAVAKDLGLDYVIWGSVRGKGSAARAKIRIAGPKGKEIAAREAGPPGSSKGNARIQKAAVGLLGKAVATVPPANREAPRTRDRKTSAAPVAPAAPAAAVAATTEPATTIAAEVEEPVAIEVSSRSASTPYAPYVTLLAGAGGRTRKIDVNVDDGAGGTGTRTYESGVYLDIVFRLEVRPLARHRVRGVRGFALEADGDFGVGLDTQPPGSTTKLDTKAWRVLGQLGYFHRFQKGELGGLIGIGFDRLMIETNSTLPSVDYLYLRVGPAYRHVFIERLLHLRVDAGFRYPFSYGDLAATFGEAKGFGFDAGLILGGELDVGFAYAARFSVDYFMPQFSGFPDGTVPPNPGAAQGRDATDLAFNFHVMVGWAF